MSLKAHQLVLTGITLVMCTSFWWYKVNDRLYDNWLQTIESDGAGYYFYLPALLSQDFAYTFTAAQAENYPYATQDVLSVDKKGNPYTKYYCGTALLNLPFFFTVYLVAKVTGAPVDGFSLPFQVGVFLAALAYFLAGLWLLYRLLLSLGYKKGVALVTICLLALGTNIGFYVWSAPAFSHVYGFFLVTALLLTFQYWTRTPAPRYLYLLAILLAFIVLTRPSTILVVLALPLLFNRWRDFIQSLLHMIRNYGWHVLLAGVVLLLLVSIQFVFYYLQTGEWIIWSYTNEGFEFAAPHWIEFLFGFKKGWLVYTPIMLLLIPGIAIWTKTNPFKAMSAILFLAILIWILSSWWNWYYGGSLGMRSMIDFYPILMLPIATGLSHISNRLQLAIIGSFVVFCIGLNQIQHYQYQKAIIHYSEMNEQSYAQIFGQTDGFYQWVSSPEVDYLPGKPYTSIRSFINEVGTSPHMECNEKHQLKEDQNNTYIVTDQANPFSCIFKVPFDQIKSSDNIIAKVDLKAKIPSYHSKALIVLTADGDDTFWYAKKITQSQKKEHEWCYTSFTFHLPPKTGFKTISAYVLNESDLPVFVGNIDVHFYYF